MALRKEEVENPMVQLGTFWRDIITQPQARSSTACDVCDEYEATVQFKHTKLCDSCASEEGIKVL